MTLYICGVVADKFLCLAYNFLHRKKFICTLIDECDNSLEKCLKEIFILLHVVLLNDRNIILSGSHQLVW